MRAFGEQRREFEARERTRGRAWRGCRQTNAVGAGVVQRRGKRRRQRRKGGTHLVKTDRGSKAPAFETFCTFPISIPKYRLELGCRELKRDKRRLEGGARGAFFSRALKLSLPSGTLPTDRRQIEKEEGPPPPRSFSSFLRHHSRAARHHTVTRHQKRQGNSLKDGGRLPTAARAWPAPHAGGKTLALVKRERSENIPLPSSLLRKPTRDRYPGETQAHLPMRASEHEIKGNTEELESLKATRNNKRCWRTFPALFFFFFFF